MRRMAASASRPSSPGIVRSTSTSRTSSAMVRNASTPAGRRRPARPSSPRARGPPGSGRARPIRRRPRARCRSSSMSSSDRVGTDGAVRRRRWIRVGWAESAAAARRSEPTAGRRCRRAAPPLCARTMPTTAGSPRPRPVNLVVKNGSKMRACTSGVMPDAGVAHRQRHVAAGVELRAEHRRRPALGRGHASRPWRW